MEGARGRGGRQQWLRWHWLVLCYILIIILVQCLNCIGCTGGGVIDKGIIPPEDEVPQGGGGSCGGPGEPGIESCTGESGKGT